MDEGNSIIYGLEHQTRALAPQIGENDAIRFLIGTQSLKCDNNQIHIVELEEETGALHTKVYKHPQGEVWHLRCSPHDVSTFVTTHNCYDEATLQCKMAVTLFKLPTTQVIPKDMSDLTAIQGRHAEPMDALQSFHMEKTDQEIKCADFHSSEQNQLAIVAESQVQIWDIENSKILSTAQPEGRAHLKFGGGKWNPHQNGWQFSAIQDTHIKTYDTRTDNAKPAWSLDLAHRQLVRDLDYNPNAQFRLATVGDDGALIIWDYRNGKEPIFTRSDHSHWVWTVRYNTYHDELILTGSSDARALLTAAVSVSSDSQRERESETLLSDEDTPTKGLGKERLQDGVLQSYEQHEDSVYCAEWSSCDPWTFASLSYDGRLVISKVPRQFKYKILL